MISLIKGTIQDKGKDFVVVLTSAGIGYEINMPAAKIGSMLLGQEVKFYTYLKISENSHALFGFENTEEKIFFTQLLSVSGVGPKSAMNILNLGSIDEISSAIAREDVKYLTSVQGLGQKTAERIVVELKTKVNNTDAEKNSGNSQILIDIIDSLVSMGYGKEESKFVAKDLDIGSKSIEELLRLALQKISK